MKSVILLDMSQNYIRMYNMAESHLHKCNQYYISHVNEQLSANLQTMWVRTQSKDK